MLAWYDVIQVTFFSLFSSEKCYSRFIFSTLLTENAYHFSVFIKLFNCSLDENDIDRTL